MKAVTSEAPTSTKRVDVRKMNDDGEEFRRRVARDFRPRRGGPNQRDLFAAMPPLEMKKMLFILPVAGGAFEKRGTKERAEVEVHRCARGALERGGG